MTEAESMGVVVGPEVRYPRYRCPGCGVVFWLLANCKERPGGELECPQCGAVVFRDGWHTEPLRVAVADWMRRFAPILEGRDGPTAEPVVAFCGIEEYGQLTDVRAERGATAFLRARAARSWDGMAECEDDGSEPF